MVVFPNAKINLGLQILFKRTDGFHELKTVFYPAKDLYDVLEIVPDAVFSFKCTGTDLHIQDDDNIVVKAFRLMQSEFKIPNVAIHLHKHIPFGAGLGGGSADAAFCMTALNEMFSLQLPKEQLASMSATLGSDCAFFIYNMPMMASGRGELLSTFDLHLKDYQLAILKPETFVSTAKAYSLITPNSDQTELMHILKSPISEWKDTLINDFETPICEAFSELASIKNKLYAAGAIYASMSGSGSAFFGIFKEKVDLPFGKVYWSSL